LFYAYRIFTENPGVVKLYNSLYKYICVDEAQDLNFAQYEVIKALCGNDYKNIMFVGDENQSIYGFNGSDSTLMSRNFVEDFKPTIFLLNENFRSSKEIVKYANQINKSDSISNCFYDGELKIISFPSEAEEADFITQRINKLLESGHKDINGNLSYNDFAIIARNKYVFREVERNFQENNIPFFHKKTICGIDNESDYMKIFELSMRMLINPKDTIHFRELCSLLGISTTINNLYDDGLDLLKHILSESNGKYENILVALSSFDIENFEFAGALKILNDFESYSISITDEEKYLIYGDIKQWEKHWKKYIAQVQKEYRTLISFRNNISLGKTQDISSDKGIALLTAHMSKGLQFEVVFIIGLTEGTFPDYRALDSQKQMEQETNNMYVAITRAKRLCYLSYPEKKQMPWGEIKNQEKSRFILTQNANMINLSVIP
jgi:DNA helicase-2/ATP-dependent DNA helicase PcrA